MGGGHLRKGEGLHAGGEAGESLRLLKMSSVVRLVEASGMLKMSSVVRATRKRRSNLFVSAKQAVLTKENGQNRQHISSPKRKEEISQLILKEEKPGDEHKRVDQ